MTSCLLDCVEISERHTAENLADQLLRIAQEWKMTGKVAACVTDNAANITLAIRKTGWKHLPCFAHTLNLIVREALEVIKPTVDKVKDEWEEIREAWDVLKPFEENLLTVTQGMPQSRITLQGTGTLRKVVPALGQSAKGEWSDGTYRWVQKVSRAPTPRLEITELQNKLTAKLLKSQAREHGICNVREALFLQCFEEMVRQETINCPERGLLLMQILDEFSTCMAVFQTLDESGSNFSIRKMVECAVGKTEREKELAVKESEKRALELQLKEKQAECAAIELKEMERQDLDKKKRTEEIEFLKRTNQQLKFQLMGSAPKC
ncbi:hypothetical protein AAFF_G00007550 [Aldrovandia affinis]|uniref:Axonemal dynein light intermediate polypeptide 1 n=1 Tax=Aldrovandia affinis TaxID=143900 RepID=A0AAD7T720_9TELE|nr:hypothetical protein AAFF_G00007550 [Aldrovandia affinis]